MLQLPGTRAVAVLGGFANVFLSDNIFFQYVKLDYLKLIKVIIDN